MEVEYQCSKSGLRAKLIRQLGRERDCAEQELLDAGLPLALSHRAVWAAHRYRRESWFLLVRDQHGRACAGVAIERARTRALPGHVILRVGKFGGSLPQEVSRVALQTIAQLAKRNPRVLRLHVNVFSRDRRKAIADTLEQLGFREIQPPSSYRHTLVIDLKPSEDAIFASFSSNARRKIRESIKTSLRSIVITDPVYAERLHELQHEALLRTGGRSPSQDWRGILRMSHENPNISRVVGLFPGEDTSPEKMGAFLWACNHGDHGEYRAAGSTRRGDLRIPYGYLLTWDVIRWAKATGAEWFDMGGVTLPEGDEPELEGISRFKRYFSRQIAEVGAEWVFEPFPLRARFATLVSRGASHVREWIRRG